MQKTCRFCEIIENRLGVCVVAEATDNTSLFIFLFNIEVRLCVSTFNKKYKKYKKKPSLLPNAYDYDLQSSEIVRTISVILCHQSCVISGEFNPFQSSTSYLLIFKIEDHT